MKKNGSGSREDLELLKKEGEEFNPDLPAIEAVHEDSEGKVTVWIAGMAWEGQRGLIKTIQGLEGMKKVEGYSARVGGRVWIAIEHRAGYRTSEDGTQIDLLVGTGVAIGTTATENTIVDKVCRLDEYPSGSGKKIWISREHRAGHRISGDGQSVDVILRNGGVLRTSMTKSTLERELEERRARDDKETMLMLEELAEEEKKGKQGE